jgi:hypothetical protein
MTIAPLGQSRLWDNRAFGTIAPLGQSRLWDNRAFGDEREIKARRQELQTPIPESATGRFTRYQGIAVR